MSDLDRADPPRWMDLPSEHQARIRAVLHRMAWRRAQQERLRPEAADDNVTLSQAAEGRLSGRIGPTHLERLAIVYVRQSTPQQIERNQELTRLQYALVERATQLGWSAGQVVVIDD